jgi:hypothetical protein
MSIYASGYDIGMDDVGSLTGTALEYQRSHVFPSPDHPRGAVYLASIPAHCVPGASEDEEWGSRVAEFLRLSVAAHGAMIAEDADVVLTVSGAVELRDALNDWLSRDKLAAS